MKVISLLQPWASLLVRGAKMVETRSWPTNYRGPIFIHASGSLNKKYKDSEMTPALMSLESFFKGFIKPQELVFGQVIGMVNIGTCVSTEEIKPHLSEQEIAFGDYETGRWAWQCYSPVEFTNPFPLKGQLGIRDIPGGANLCAGCDLGYFPNKHGMHPLSNDPDCESFLVCVNMKDKV